MEYRASTTEWHRAWLFGTLAATPDREDDARPRRHLGVLTEPPDMMALDQANHRNADMRCLCDGEFSRHTRSNMAKRPSALDEGIHRTIGYYRRLTPGIEFAPFDGVHVA